MLNTNKIHSLINKGQNNASAVSRGTGINYRTLKSKLESDSWTANDIEILADYFNKSIPYFFDREPEKDLSKEPEIKYFSCPDCIKKQKELDDMRAERDALRLEVLELYRHKKG